MFLVIIFGSNKFLHKQKLKALVRAFSQNHTLCTSLHTYGIYYALYIHMNSKTKVIKDDWCRARVPPLQALTASTKAPPHGRTRATPRQKALDKIQRDKIDRLISVETKIATVKSGGAT